MTGTAVKSGRGQLVAKLQAFAVPIALVALMGVATAVQPTFLSPNNLQDILIQAALLRWWCWGSPSSFWCAGFDLSVATLMFNISMLATAFNATSDAMIPVIFVAAIMVLALVGLINGLFVARRHVPPFLAKLAMMIVLQGIRFYYTQGSPSDSLPDGFHFLGAGQVLGVPANVLAFALCFAFLGWLLHKSSFGRQI